MRAKNREIRVRDAFAKASIFSSSVTKLKAERTILPPSEAVKSELHALER